MRKWFYGVFLMVAVVFGLMATPDVASAQDYYSCTDRMTGYSYYVMTETIDDDGYGKIFVSTRQVAADGVHSRVLKWGFAFDEGSCYGSCITDSSLTPSGNDVRNSAVARSIIRTTYYLLHGKNHPYLS
jgi:hypothetical protein